MALPTVRPAKTPVVGSTVPRAAVALDHVPPDTVLVNVAVAPAHTLAGPASVPADGAGLTVATEVTMHTPPIT
jgi:hypothetical protein